MVRQNLGEFRKDLDLLVLVGHTLSHKNTSDATVSLLSISMYSKYSK